MTSFIGRGKFEGGVPDKRLQRPKKNMDLGKMATRHEQGRYDKTVFFKDEGEGVHG